MSASIARSVLFLRRSCRWRFGFGPLMLSMFLAGLACGCGPKAIAPVNLDGAWPDAPGSYEAVHQEWTRHGILQKYPVQVLELFATLKAPAWRAAHIGFVTEQQKLTESERAALIERERAAGGEGPYELHLLVTTHDRRENKLANRSRSPWTLVLMGANGAVIEAESIERDRRPRDLIQAEFPQLGDFAEVYVARFPRTQELFGPDNKQITLRMSSMRGSVELIWQQGL